MNKEKTDIIFALGEAEYSVSGDWLDYSQYGFNQDDAEDLITLAINKTLYFSDDNKKMWVPIHAWRILGLLASEAAVLPLITLFDLVIEQDDDGALTDFPHVMGMIGQVAIMPLAAFLNDNGQQRDEFSYVIAVEGLSQIAKKHPASRKQILSIYQDYMRSPKPDHRSLNGLLIAAVLDINGQELLEDMRTLFVSKCVDLSIVGDMEDVEIALGIRDKRETPKLTFEQMHGFSPDLMKSMTTEESIALIDDKPEKPDDKEDVIAWIDYYFMLYGNDESILDASELDGFCAALACSPEVLLPSAWIPAMWGGEDFMPEWESMQEAGDFNKTLFIMYNHVLTQLNNNDYEPLFLENEMADIAIVDEWCEGFLKGIDLWDPLSADDFKVVEEESLPSIRLFATKQGFDKLEKMQDDEVKAHQDYIGSAVQGLFDYFSEQRMASIKPEIRTEPKVGRNDPCPCGSGKKYKKCCLH